MFIFYGFAMALLAFAGALMVLFGELASVRRVALACCSSSSSPPQACNLGSAARAAAGIAGRLLLPEQCRGCGVAFLPPDRGRRPPQKRQQVSPDVRG